MDCLRKSGRVCPFRRSPRFSERGMFAVNWVHLLETLMLVCFGAAWPLSILKSWRARTARGKSLGFLTVILLGYTAGIAKVYLVDGFQGFLLIPYSINFTLVGIETLLYFRNARIDRETEREALARFQSEP